MVELVKSRTITPEEYLALERKSETKSEYRNGEIVPMPGASRRHNLIATSISASLYIQLRQQSCEAYQGQMRVKVSRTGLYTYPDITVVCEEPRLEDEQFDTLLNPNVIFEVLSPSTANYDRGEKFQHYCAIPSLTDYVLVAQNACHVEHFARQADDKWLLTEFKRMDQVVELTSIDCTLALADVYAKVEMPPATSSALPTNGQKEQE